VLGPSIWLTQVLEEWWLTEGLCKPFLLIRRCRMKLIWVELPRTYPSLKLMKGLHRLKRSLCLWSKYNLREALPKWLVVRETPTELWMLH
jgi:hypothetical protein